MKYKLDYITRFFQKTSSKAIENYVLTRLWHRLDNDQIKIVPQQYVNRHNEKYALTDVYFPQFKIHIEVNEPAHYLSEERILADKTRRHQIESITGHKLIEIDCRKDLLTIHEDSEKIIIEIQELTKYQILNNKFQPWNPDMERSPKFWKEKNTISIKDEVSFSNIEDICDLFNANFMQTKRGFLRLGGISHPQNNQILLWWPSSHTRQGWVNKINEAENAIIETHTDENKK